MPAPKNDLLPDAVTSPGLATWMGAKILDLAEAEEKRLSDAGTRTRIGDVETGLVRAFAEQLTAIGSGAS